MTLRAPEPLLPVHHVGDFDCGRPELNAWLRVRALANQLNGTSRTYVVCDGPGIAGYYALATGAIAHADAPRAIRRNAPDPVPAILLGRLAVDLRHQGRGFGASLLRDAMLRIARAGGIVGIRAVVVDALDTSARDFYLKHGFRASLSCPLKLMMAIDHLHCTIAHARAPS